MTKLLVNCIGNNRKVIFIIKFIYITVVDVYRSHAIILLCFIR
jgi:hypothetical protein